MNRIKITGAAAAASIAIAIPLIGKWEGVSTTPYYDIGGVLTVCYGETVNVKKSDVYTKTECEQMLADRVPDYYNGAMQHVTYEDVPVQIQAAITSFSYNVGVNAFKNSTLLRKLNKGDFVGACMELDRWVYDNGKVIKGLANRRKEEKALCFEGATTPPTIKPPPVELPPGLPPVEPELNWLQRFLQIIF